MGGEKIGLVVRLLLAAVCLVGVMLNRAAPVDPVHADPMDQSAIVSGYQPMTPARILDTRAGAPVGRGGVICIPAAGWSSVPAGATGVQLNVTVDQPSTAGYVSVYPSGSPVPPTSSLNFSAGQTTSNAVATGLGTDGSFCVYNFAGTVHVIADVQGYFVHGGGARFTSVYPARLFDSRDSGNNSFPAGGVAPIQVAGLASVPATAVAAVLNVTAVDSTDPGYLTVWPDGEARPTASNLNFPAGALISNQVVAKIGAGGKVDIYSYSGWVDVVVDVAGYYDYNSYGSALAPMVPVRAYDSRAAGPIPAGTSRAVPVMVPGVPGNVDAVVLNITSTGTAAPGYFTVFPNGSPLPPSSNLNFQAGQSVPNMVVAKPGPDGQVAVYSFSTAQVVVDVVGWLVVPNQPPQPVPSPQASPHQILGLFSPRPSLSAQAQLINQQRASAGLPPLKWNGCLAGVAQQHAGEMAAQDRLFHGDGVYRDLGCVPGSRQTGENVGYWSAGVNDQLLAQMFWNSPEHRANILGPYNYVGTAWVVASNGHGYVSVEFA